MIVFLIILSHLRLQLVNEALAFCPTPPAVVKGHRDLIIHTGNTDGISLLDAAEYGRPKGLTGQQVEEQHSGTTTFHCGPQWGQANVVFDDQTIVIPQHLLLEENKCAKRKTSSDCELLVQSGGKLTPIPLGKVLGQGTCQGVSPAGPQDFVFFRLKKKVPSDIKPYQFSTRSAGAGDKLTIAGRSRGFDPKDTKNALMLPKGFADCMAMGQSSFAHAGMMQTNCPVDFGCSGCAITDQDDPTRLKGIMIGVLSTRPICPDGKGPEEPGPFLLNCRGSQILPLEGDFKAAVDHLQAKYGKSK